MSEDVRGFELMLRPRVGMQHYVAVPVIVALALTDVLEECAIAWPDDVVDRRNGTPVACIRAHAGYDEDGMFCTVACEPTSDEVARGWDDVVLASRVEERVDAWAHGLAKSSRTAPLAAVLADYADRLCSLGEAVSVTYPNGQPYATGTFVGVDVWGRATVWLADGSEMEFAPERYRIVARRP